MKKNKLIIVEGADCCGKTTLSKAIASLLNASYWHFTSTKKLAQANTDYMMNGLENARDNLELGRHVVFDRFWPSERCYGQVLRPDTTNAEDALALYEACKDLDPIYIFTADKDGMGQAVRRHQSFKDPDHPYGDVTYGQVYGKYLELQVEMQNRGDQLITYYFNHQDFEQGLKGVDKVQLYNILSLYHLG